jgi:hypothetical protein
MADVGQRFAVAQEAGLGCKKAAAFTARRSRAT